MPDASALEAAMFTPVRLRTHRKLEARMIPGAQPIDLDDLGGPLAQIPSGRDVVVYWACPNDATAVEVATAVKVAMLLRRRGILHVRPLAGGFDAWVRAGLTTDA